jgi:Flp pilus assembly protein TadG
MPALLGLPDDSRRPGDRTTHDSAATGDDGAVTVEAAFAVMALVCVAVALSWCVTLVGAELALGEAARAAARVAARGGPPDAAPAEARRLVATAHVEVRRDGDHVAVVVTRSLGLPGALAAWGEVGLRADAVAAIEAAS